MIGEKELEPLDQSTLIVIYNLVSTSIVPQQNGWRPANVAAEIIRGRLDLASDELGSNENDETRASR